MVPFLIGLAFGLIFIFSLGPAFFALIQTSLQRGLRKATFFAIGISMSDIFYVAISLLGLSKFMETESFRFWIAIIGFFMLTGYAIHSWFKTPVIANEMEVKEDVHSLQYMLRGFLLNALNPFMVVTWAGWIGVVTVRFNYDFAQLLQFFLGVLTTILSTDILKAFIANRLKHLITVKRLRTMNRSVAVLIMIFSLQIAYFLWTNYL